MKAECSGGEDPEQVRGKVRIQLHVFNLSIHGRLCDFKQQRSTNAPLVVPPIGKACATAALAATVKSLRGLPKDWAHGKAKVRIRVGTCTLETSPCRFQEPKVHNTEGGLVDPHLESAIEYLAREQDLSHAHIAAACNLDEEVVTAVLLQRPTYSTVWNHALHFMIAEPHEETVHVDLVCSKSHIVLASLQEPFKLHTLIKEQKGKMAWYGDLDLVKPEEHSAGHFPGMMQALHLGPTSTEELPKGWNGQFHLLCSFELWALKAYTCATNT